MEAKKHSGQIGRQKYMYKVGNRMIIMGNEREWRRDCMLPIGVRFRKGRLLRMQRVAMEDIGHHLIRQRAGLSTWNEGAYLAKEQAEEQVFGDTPWHR